jgi:hypothetical protein
MKRFRVQVPAFLAFEVEVSDDEGEAEARHKASEVVKRTEDGIDLDDWDTEETDLEGVAYPATDGEPAVLDYVTDEEAICPKCHHVHDVANVVAGEQGVCKLCGFDSRPTNAADEDRQAYTCGECGEYIPAGEVGLSVDDYHARDCSHRP